MSAPEEAPTSSTGARRGVLLVNLGSPDAPEPAALRRYLNEFLMDPYVIDAPRLVRRLIVSGFILPFRPRKSAEAYAEIWDEGPAPGAPLVTHSQALTNAVAARTNVPVALAMRYGSLTLEGAIAELAERRVDEILLVPLYPHHADSTRTTITERVRAILADAYPDLRLRVLPPFYDQAHYLDLLAEHTRRHLPDDIQLLLCSYHGLPERHIVRADPTGSHCLASANCCETPSPAHASCYRHHALMTTEALRARLGRDDIEIESSFQSRLGRLPWLSPYTDVVLGDLPQRGVTRIAVTAPAFVADNLETLEELGIRGQETFMEAGGESFTLLPCLNDEPGWVDLLTRWVAEPLPESAIDRA